MNHLFLIGLTPTDGWCFLIAVIEKENTYSDFVFFPEHINPLFYTGASREGMCAAVCTRLPARPSHWFPSSPYAHYLHHVLTLIPALVLSDRMDAVSTWMLNRMNLPFSFHSSIMQNLLAIIFHCLNLKLSAEGFPPWVLTSHEYILIIIMMQWWELLMNNHMTVSQILWCLLLQVSFLFKVHYLCISFHYIY